MSSLNNSNLAQKKFARGRMRHTSKKSVDSNENAYVRLTRSFASIKPPCTHIDNFIHGQLPAWHKLGLGNRGTKTRYERAFRKTERQETCSNWICGAEGVHTGWPRKKKFVARLAD